MSLFTGQKDPDDTLWFGIDWADWLVADTIATSAWVIGGPDALLVQVSDNNTSTSTAVKLTNGTEGIVYRVTNTISTVGGETKSRTIMLDIAQT